jgi:hypothetical protein
MHNSRVHMMYKEHEDSPRWIPDYPGIDVMEGDGPYVDEAPAYAAPLDWSEMEVVNYSNPNLMNASVMTLIGLGDVNRPLARKLWLRPNWTRRKRRSGECTLKP